MTEVEQSTTKDPPDANPPGDPVGWTEALGEHAGNPPNPRTAGEVIYALPCRACKGKRCAKCDWTGKQPWTVSSMEARIKAQFEQWVRKNAKQSILEAEMEDGPDEAARMRDTYQAAFGAGNYTWDGRHVRSARGSEPGVRHLLFLLLSRCHPEITEAAVREIMHDNPRGCGMALGWAQGNLPSPPPAAEGGETRNGKTERTTDR